MFPGNHSVLSPILFLLYAENIILWHYNTVMVCFGRGIVGPGVLARSQFRNWVIAFSYLWFLMRLLNNICPLCYDLTGFKYLPPHMWLHFYRRQVTPTSACTTWRYSFTPIFLKICEDEIYCSDASYYALRLACVEEYCFSSVFCCWGWVALAITSLSQRWEKCGERPDPGDS